jgi:hypothetical protein
MGIIFKTKAKMVAGQVTVTKSGGINVGGLGIASGTANVGTASTNIAHGLGRVPVMVSLIPVGTTCGTVVQSAVADGTNIKAIALTAGACSWSAL